MRHTRLKIKTVRLQEAPFGIVRTGNRRINASTHNELVLGGYLTPMQMAACMSYHPAQIVGIDKGDIQPGKAADVVIFDPEETYRIDKNTFASKREEIHRLTGKKLRDV